jgi:hypothetical protein
MSNIHPILSPAPDLPSDNEEDDGDDPSNIYEATVVTYREACHHMSYTLCPPLSDIVIDVVPPNIWEALLNETDVDVILGSLDGEPSYNPAIQFATVVAALFPLWLQLKAFAGPAVIT